MAAAVFVVCGLPLESVFLTPPAEIADRLRALRTTNRAAALAPYAGHELGETEAGPFVTAAPERCPVSKAATLEAIAAHPNNPIRGGKHSKPGAPGFAW